MRKTELDKIISEVDSELNKECIPIGARPLRALIKMAARLRRPLAFHNQDQVSQYILAWFEKKYAGRLKVVGPLGEIAILIRNDPYKMIIPLVYGCGGSIIAVPNSRDQLPPINLEPIKINVFDNIKDFTQAYAAELTIFERKELILFLKWGIDAFQAIERIQSEVYVPEARGDIQIAVDSLFKTPLQCGLSKWASHQATEKLIKAFIKKSGGKVRQIHNLRMLAESAEKLGLGTLNSDNLDVVQCDPGVRYGEGTSSVQDAVEAHHASLELCATIARMFV